RPRGRGRPGASPRPRNPLPIPALRSTSTSWPRATSCRAPSGVSPTRYSLSLVSFGTPLRMVLSRLLGAIRLDQDRRDLRPDDARIRPLALGELLAHLGAADREGLLVRRRVGGGHAAERFVERREADLARPQVQLARQRLEDLLRVEVAPDRLAVV